MFDINTIGKGGVRDNPDKRDYRAEVVMGAVPLPERFSVEDVIGKLKVEHQGKSGSCVAQAWAKYVEALNKKETNGFTDLSAKDIYSLIYIPELSGGAYIRDGAKKLVSSGVLLEQDMPSYEGGNPPSEAYMRNRPLITEEVQEKGMAYLAKSYVRLPSSSFEGVKQAIYQNLGCIIGFYGDNPGWTQFGGIIRPPQHNDWAHVVYAVGFDNDKIKFINSWGEEWGTNGYGYVGQDYFRTDNNGYAYWVFNPWTIMDLPNGTYPHLKHQILQATELLKRLAEQVKNLLSKKK